MVTKSLLFMIFTIFLLFALCQVSFAVLAVGADAPDFTLPTMTGGTFNLYNSFTGSTKFVFLDFWTSWCSPCRTEMPYLISMHNDYSNQGIKFVGIGGDSPSSASYSYAQSINVNYTICGDPNFAVTTSKYDFDAIPTGYIVDWTGTIRYAEVGFRVGQEVDMRAELDELIASVPEPASVTSLLAAIGVFAGCVRFGKRRG